MDLPNKKSELLKLALRDLEVVEKDDKYTVDMHNYYCQKMDSCYVCLAGAVMANTLDAESIVIENRVHTYMYGESNKNKLRWLNDVREFCEDKHNNLIEVCGIDHCEYDDDPDNFKVSIRKVIEYYESHPEIDTF
jgi:hypothetical protein